MRGRVTARVLTDRRVETPGRDSERRRLRAQRRLQSRSRSCLPRTVDNPGTGRKRGARARLEAGRHPGHMESGVEQRVDRAHRHGRCRIDRPRADLMSPRWRVQRGVGTRRLVEPLQRRRVERTLDRDRVHAHLIRQRPTCRVVWRNRWSARIRAQIGIVLRLEQVLRERAEWLRHQDHVRSGWIAHIVGHEGTRGAVHLDRALHQRREKRHAAGRIVLIRSGDDVGDRRITPSRFNLPRADVVDAVQQLLPDISLQYRARPAIPVQHVLHRISQVERAALPRVRIRHARGERRAHRSRAWPGSLTEL